LEKIGYTSFFQTTSSTVSTVCILANQNLSDRIILYLNFIL